MKIKGPRQISRVGSVAEEMHRVDRLSAFVESQAVEGDYEVIDVVDE